MSKKLKQKIVIGCLFIVGAFISLNFYLNGVVLHLVNLVFLSLVIYLAILRAKLYLAQFLVVLLIVELGLHYFSPYKSYMEKNGDLAYIAPYFPHPNPAPYPAHFVQYDRKPEFNYAHKFNALGYKDTDLDTALYKALILGDSFVQGIGTDSTHSIDKLLEKQVECNDCILNMGLAGNELSNSFNALKAINKQGVQAQYVILNLNKTDLNDLQSKCKQIEALNFKGPSYLFQFGYGASYMVRHLAHELFNLHSDLLTTTEQNNLRPKLMNYIYTQIIAYDEYCRQTGSSFVLVFQPLFEECQEKKYLFEELDEKLAITHPEIAVVNLLHVFENDCESFYWPIDLHFNTDGYIQYSTALYDSLSLLNNDFSQ